MNSKLTIVKKNIFNILIGLFFIIYDYTIAFMYGRYQYPEVIILNRNFSGHILGVLFRLVLLILFIIYIIKCKSKIFKIILSCIFFLTMILFGLKTMVGLFLLQETPIESYNISNNKYIESYYYPISNDSGVFDTDCVSIIYRQKLFGHIYCIKDIYNISSDESRLSKDEFIKQFPIEKFYDEIKEKDLGFCGSKIDYKSLTYKDGKLIDEEHK